MPRLVNPRQLMFGQPFVQAKPILLGGSHYCICNYAYFPPYSTPFWTLTTVVTKYGNWISVTFVIQNNYWSYRFSVHMLWLKGKICMGKATTYLQKQPNGMYQATKSTQCISCACYCGPLQFWHTMIIWDIVISLEPCQFCIHGLICSMPGIRNHYVSFLYAHCVGVHVDFTSILHSHAPLVPQT